MTDTKLLEEVINWNKKKAETTKDPADKARYEDNIRRLLGMKNSSA